MPNHGRHGIDLDTLMESIREAVDRITKIGWTAFLGGEPITKAEAYCAARVLAAVHRFDGIRDALIELAKIREELEGAQAMSLSAARWYLHKLERLNPDLAASVREKAEAIVSVSTPEPDDAEQPDADGAGMEGLSDHEAVVLMLSLHGGPMKKGEIIAGLRERGREITEGALRDVLTAGRDQAVFAMVPPGSAMPKWALTSSG